MKKDLSNKEIIQDLYARPPAGLKYKKTNLIQIFDGDKVIAEYDSSEDKAVVRDKKKFREWKEIIKQRRLEHEIYLKECEIVSNNNCASYRRRPDDFLPGEGGVGFLVSDCLNVVRNHCRHKD